MSDLLASSQDSAHGATKVLPYAPVPGTSVRLLTQTSKMPGPSWSLPAHRACPRANGTICESCYSSKGCYKYNATVNAQETRFKWTVECMRSDSGRREFVEVMVQAIVESKCT